jgi:hypothetical protein
MYRKINNNAEFRGYFKNISAAWKKPLSKKKLIKTVTPSPNLNLSNPKVSYKVETTTVKPTAWTRGSQVVSSGKAAAKPVTDIFTELDYRSGKRKLNLKRTAGLAGLGVAGVGYYKANKYLNSKKPKQVNPIVEWWNS